MPVLPKAGAGLRHTQPTATLALYFAVGHCRISGLLAAARELSALGSACRRLTLGQRQIPALRRLAPFPGPVGALAFLAGCGFVFQRFLERCVCFGQMGGPLGTAASRLERDYCPGSR